MDDNIIKALIEEKKRMDNITHLEKTFQTGVLMRSYPAANDAPVVHGEWIKDEHGALYCNICGNGAEERFGEQCETPYCNNCGAVMKNGGEPVDYKSLYPWLRLRYGMTQEERLHVCDMGYYNGVIAGYMKRAMENAGFSPTDIQKAMTGLHYALDDLTAAEAENLIK